MRSRAAAGTTLPAAPTLARLGRALAAAGYSEDALSGRLRHPSTLDASPADRPLHLALLDEGDALATLARLFLVDEPTSASDAARALRPLELAELAAEGLLAREEGAVRSPFRIQPHAGLLVASDHGFSPDAGPDYVGGVNPAARTLASLTIRAGLDSALDLGTGCGVQALALARHTGTVLATDVNPRAVFLACLNAGLNELSNVTCRSGSWFDPAGGARFDLIVSNPPFVISPDTEFEFRDGGLARDGVSRLVATEAARHLTDGGFAQVMCNWVHEPRGDPAAPVRAWVEGGGCDALLLHHQSFDPLRYAAVWNRHLSEARPPAFARSFERWLDHYRREGIEAIGAGLVTLRRRASGGGWFLGLEASGRPPAGGGDQVLRIFSAQDRLAALPSERALLDNAFAPVEGHRIDQALTYRDGRHARHPAVIRLDAGAGIEAKVDAESLDVLFSLREDRSLGQIVADVAARKGRAEHEVEAGALDAVRTLYERGLLVRAAGD